jgi:hypothetical protein
MRSDVVSGVEGAADVRRAASEGGPCPKAALRDDCSERPRWVDSCPSLERGPTARLRRAVIGQSCSGGSDRPVQRALLIHAH